MAETSKHLTHAERCHIEAQLSSGRSYRDIAATIGYHASTISREVTRSGATRETYRADEAQRLADARRSRASSQPRKVTPAHMDHIYDSLLEGHSPDVIAHGLDRPELRLSTSWIYELLDRDVAQGEDECKTLLRHKYRKWSRRGKPAAGVKLIPNRRDIDDRPSVVDSRETFGHWEGDTIVGAHHQGAIVTLLERQSRYLVCFGVDTRTKDAVADGIVQAMQALPREAVRTITFDNGGEFAAHERVAASLGCDVFFAKPYHSWQRGANENVNGLVRRFFPKGESLRGVDPEEVAFAQAHINTLRRRVLGFRTAADCFEEAAGAVASG